MSWNSNTARFQDCDIACWNMEVHHSCSRPSSFTYIMCTIERYRKVYFNHYFGTQAPVSSHLTCSILRVPVTCFHAFPLSMQFLTMHHVSRRVKWSHPGTNDYSTRRGQPPTWAHIVCRHCMQTLWHWPYRQRDPASSYREHVDTAGVKTHSTSQSHPTC